MKRAVCAECDGPLKTEEERTLGLCVECSSIEEDFDDEAMYELDLKTESLHNHNFGWGK